MIQLDISTALAKPLAKHLRLAPSQDTDLYWRADLAVVGTEPCVVAEEQQTGYVIVLCGLDREDFARFPDLFRDRLWREVAAICKQANLYDNGMLAKYLPALCEQQYYRHDPEPIEEGRILKVIEQLERRFLYDRESLPYDGRSAFEFSFAINNKKSRTDTDTNRPSAAESLGDFCLNWMEARIDAGEGIEPEAETSAAVTSVRDNIVSVDFSQRRR